MEDTALAVPSFGLPCELYREIAMNLQEPFDRPHLIALALVNTAWRKESQRILFGMMCDGSDKPSYWARFGCIAMHMRFLETILAYPQRLGPLVRSYAQIYLVDIDHSKQNSSYILNRSKVQGRNSDLRSYLPAVGANSASTPSAHELEGARHCARNPLRDSLGSRRA